MGNNNVEILEKGNIYFFYRPKIDVKGDISGVDDLQNFYCVLSSYEGKKPFRLIVIGREKLPDVSKNEKFWGFVARASTKKQVKEELESAVYKTKTRGERKEPAARPCGEGVYEIVRHEDHTHLVYALELPEEPDEVQKALKIQQEGNYIVSVKNPERGQPSYAGLSKGQKADFPKKIQEKFEGKKFVPLNPPDFLNYEHAEVLFIGVDKEVKQELGIKLEPQKETETKADIFKELNLNKEEHPVEPLFEGEWQ